MVGIHSQRWLFHGETPQIRLQAQAPIDNFHLAVGLWVVSRTHSDGCMTKAEQLGPKSAEEKGISI